MLVICLQQFLTHARQPHTTPYACMRRRGEGRSSRRLRGTGGIELDAAIVHQDPEAAMREIRRLRAAQEARPRASSFQRCAPLVCPVPATQPDHPCHDAVCGLVRTSAAVCS